MNNEDQILKALKHLSSVCNYATSNDGQGFNKLDAELGHSLGALNSLTDMQRKIAYKMLQKYKGQLEKAGITLTHEEPNMNSVEDTTIPTIEEQIQDPENTGITLSEDQDMALNKIVNWWKETKNTQSISEPIRHMTLGGFAGTGKTTIMLELRKAIDAKYVNFMAFTGKATLNMRKKLYASNVMKPQDECTTIHKFTYSPIIDEKTGQIKEWRKSPKRTPDLIIIDEAPMVNREIWNDLVSIGVPILAVGDHGQLPPIQKGDPFNLMENPQIRLEKIHRQAEDSPIIRFSMMAREGKFIPFHEVRNGGGIAAKVSSFSKYIDLLEQDKFDEGELYVLTDLNRRRVRLNESILQRFSLQPKDGYPCPGSRLICLKNNMKNNPPIFNGMHCTLKEVRSTDNWGNFAAKLVDDEGNNFWLNKVSSHFFLNETGKAPEGIDWRTIGEQFDYGYCMTVHKAQGSEADRVFIFGTGFGEPSDRARWLYTAITRAKKELYICGDKI